MAIDNKNIVEKRNVLNEIRRNSMSLQEMRFFSIYLSKINARDIKTRKVKFPLKDFQRIMEYGRLNIAQLQETTNSLLGKVVNIRTENGGYKGFQLFKECTVDKDEDGKWYVEIDAHDQALPLMFDFKRDYFTYELWNALRLKSPNQLRMYEILKQYEKVGQRKLRLDDLKQLLGLSPLEYPRWTNFRVRILDACQEALAQTTDICFTYTPIKDGKKVCGVHFFIEPNTEYQDQLTLEEFIDLQGAKDAAEEEDGHFDYSEPDVVYDEDSIFDHSGSTDPLAMAADSLPPEFTSEEVEALRLVAIENIGFDFLHPDPEGVRVADYLARYTASMLAANSRKKINDKYKWMMAAMKKKWYD